MLQYPNTVYRPVWHPTPAPPGVLPGTDGSVVPTRAPAVFRLDQFSPPWKLEPWAWLLERLGFYTPPPDGSIPPTAPPRISLVPYLTPAWALTGSWGQPATRLLPPAAVAQDIVPFLPLSLLTRAPWSLSAPWQHWLRRPFTPDASVVPLAPPRIPLAPYLAPLWSRSGAWARPALVVLPQTPAAQDTVPFSLVSLLLTPPWTLAAPWQRLLRPPFTPDASLVPLSRPQLPLAAYLPPGWTLSGPWRPGPRALPQGAAVQDAVPANLLRLLLREPWGLSAPWRAALRQAWAFTPDASKLPLSDPAALRRAWAAVMARSPLPWRTPFVFAPITLLPLVPGRVLLVPSLLIDLIVPMLDVDFIAPSVPIDLVVPAMAIDFEVPSQTIDFIVPEDGPMIIGPPITKQPNETFPPTVDFKNRCKGSNIASVVITAKKVPEGTDSSALLSSPTFAGTIAQVRLIAGAGTVGDNHLIQFRVTTAAGDTFEAEVPLHIREE